MGKYMPVTDKQLIPSKFGFDNKTVTKSVIISDVKRDLKEIVGDKNAINFCNYLLKKSADGYSQIDKPKTELSTQEINIILKDFGEITGAVYLMSSNTSYKSVKFPAGAEKLIDYTMITEDGTEEKFSAKAGQGGKPSIVSIMPIIDKMPDSKMSASEKKAKTVLKHLATEEKNGLFYGPLYAAKYLNTSGYKGLISLLKSLKIEVSGGIPTPQQLEQAVKSVKTFDNMKKKFKIYFAEAGYMMNESVTRRLFETPSSSEKIWGILHYPITAELVKWLNNDSNSAKKLLTKAASGLSVNQIYLDTTSNYYKYTVKSFSKASFQFGTPSSMPRPINNRIGFTMIKGMQEKVK